MGYFFIFLSLLFFFLGIAIYTGKFKKWWLLNSNPVTPVGIFYALIPSALFFFVFGILILLPILPEKRREISNFTIIPLMIAIVVFGTWQPNWLKPKWLRWLETNYPDHLQLLHDKAQQMGAGEWEKRVRTQEDLESWAAEVCEKINR